MVDPGAYVSSSTPILTLAVPDPLKVVVNVPEKDVNMARVGMVRLRLASPVWPSALDDFDTLNAPLANPPPAPAL